MRHGIGAPRQLADLRSFFINDDAYFGFENPGKPGFQFFAHELQAGIGCDQSAWVLARSGLNT
jgi:hypothetical protein